MKTLLILLLGCSMANSATLWNYTNGLHTTVIETEGKYTFRYNYVPNNLFTFPNKEYVTNYRVEYLKETFEYGDSLSPPEWGPVTYNGKTFNTYIPVPEPNCLLLGLLGFGIWKRRR